MNALLWLTDAFHPEDADGDSGRKKQRSGRAEDRPSDATGGGASAEPMTPTGKVSLLVCL